MNDICATFDLLLMNQFINNRGFAMSEIYDCIVVGAGIQGSSAGYQLAKRGLKTLIIEQVWKCLLIFVSSPDHTV